MCEGALAINYAYTLSRQRNLRYTVYSACKHNQHQHDDKWHAKYWGEGGGGGIFVQIK